MCHMLDELSSLRAHMEGEEEVQSVSKQGRDYISQIKVQIILEFRIHFKKKKKKQRKGDKLTRIIFLD